jgi:hypothetical protein
MRTLASLMAGTLALALTLGDAPRSPTPAPLQVADMGMGPDGPELGGSQDDMVLTDPGHVPAEAGMITSDPGHVPNEANMVLSDPGTLPPPADQVVTDPGHIPSEAQMDVDTPRDDDLQDDILP